MRLLFFAGILLCLFSTEVSAAAIPVALEKTLQGWQLLRGGEPYFIRGAGGKTSLKQLADAGANSIRTWGAENIDGLLDQAHELGLSVTVGIWLGHERHGFDYNDTTQLAKQMQSAREAVLRYKDHPAVLLWGIGNEMEGYESGDNPQIWKAVNDVAAMVKQLDPHHPTMTVTADIGGERVEYLHRHSPAIDIHGINSYGGAPSLPQRLSAQGATKPFVLTEFGPPGAWEVARTAWDAPIEQTSTEKAASYRASYEQAIIAAPGDALGSYVFNWGFKMEATATWYGMFLPDGSRLAAVDTMTELWSDSPPHNLAPTVQPLRVNGPTEVKPRSKLKVHTTVDDPEGSAVTTRWALLPESQEYMTGGDFRPMPAEIDGAVIAGNSTGAQLRMPPEPGPYRLFVYAYDEAGNAATANLPLLVQGKPRTPMPFYVYQDGLEGMPWVPSGWMGDIDSLTIDGKHKDNPHDGTAYIKMRYEGRGWVAVAWQNPPNNWGDMEGGFDLSSASQLELWARGEYGGEQIKIGVGLIGNDTANPDSALKAVDKIMLTSKWNRYRIRLKRADLSSIKTGFVVTITGRSTPVTIYLDNIRYIR